MKFRDHSFRTKKPDYNISLQLTYSEMDRLANDLTGHFPDWEYEDCILADFAALLHKEIKTRSGRKRNPGWVNGEKSAINTRYNETLDGPRNSMDGDDHPPKGWLK